jgi:hypothetical protein
MKLLLETSSGRTKCRGLTCKKLPEYISEKGRIKAGTKCVCFWMESASGWAGSYYCRDCIDQLYIEMKKILNPNLWALH